MVRYTGLSPGGGVAMCFTSISTEKIYNCSTQGQLGRAEWGEKELEKEEVVVALGR